MTTPLQAKYLIIGDGIHGLSTAYHLALELRSRGLGSGEDILAVDKATIGAGASGIACGVVRNNYFQPAKRELMAHSVCVWESDPKAYGYHSVGYLQISPEVMHEDVASIARQQEEIGYDSIFVEGEKDCEKYMKALFEDWQAKEVTSIFHETRGGFANNTKALFGLAGKAEAEGVTILTPTEVTGFTGTLPKYKKEPSGGIGAFTPDRFPVFDVFRENCYFIADSHHGYKMLGVGKLVAAEVCGDKSRLLEPFRLSRFKAASYVQ